MRAAVRFFHAASAPGLRTEGVAEFLDILELYARPGDNGEDFSARVYKIARDAQGNRMTFMKVTGRCAARAQPDEICRQGRQCL